MQTQFEKCHADILARQRAANEARYRVLIFQYEASGLSDAETIELADLVTKLGLPTSAPDDAVGAIRQSRRMQAEANEVFDFEALEAARGKAFSEANEALCQSIADFFRGRPLEDTKKAREEIRGKCPWLHFRPELAHVPPFQLPDRNTSELCDAANEAQSALSYAESRRPSAIRQIDYLKQQNPILWP